MRPESAHGAPRRSGAAAGAGLGQLLTAGGIGAAGANIFKRAAIGAAEGAGVMGAQGGIETAADQRIQGQPFDFVITVCDRAKESCPVWPGQPMTAHWGIEDPAAVEGEGQRQAFIDAIRFLRRRIELFLELPLKSLDAMAMDRKLKEIGQSDGASLKAEKLQ
jgi:hypothetical protein